MPGVIINFHGIGQPEREMEPGEAPYWIETAFFHEIVRIIAARPDRARIGLTIDDGNRSDIAIAAPAFRAAGLKAAIFPLSGRIDRPGSLSAVEIAALHGDGFVIGSHGADHVDWRHLDGAGRRREFTDARAAIAAATGAPVAAAAIPFGCYDRAVLAALKAEGYTAIYTSDGGPAGPGPVFARTSVTAAMTPETIVALLDGAESPLRRLRRRAAKLKKRLI